MFIQWELIFCIQAEGGTDGRTNMTKTIVGRRQLGTYYYLHSTVYTLC